MRVPVSLTFILLFVPDLMAQFYEDKRCKCICPSIGAIVNQTLSTNQKLFIAYVPPSLCTCDSVILPKFGSEIKGYEQEVCTRCECKYETRDTTIIFVVVVLVIWMIGLLVVYMLFITCLGPLATRKRYISRNTRPTEEAQQRLLNHNNDHENMF